MPLPKLVPGSQQVNLQETAFSVDALGRCVCSTNVLQAALSMTIHRTIGA